MHFYAKDIGRIQFSHVSKQYRKGKLLLKEALLDIFRPRQTEAFWALKDINFDIAPGEVVGIIGPNGSGKSTLLKLLAGVASPTSGRISVSGRVAPLIELGAGFHFELTGRENIYINSAILGLSKKETDAHVKQIIDFAELGDFIDTPIKHYSSGDVYAPRVFGGRPRPAGYFADRRDSGGRGCSFSGQILC